MLNPIIRRKMSSSSRPRHIKAILKAGTKFENGMGRGSDKKAEEITIASPQII